MSADRDFLNKLQIASPCPAAWAEMSGDDRARFCAACEKHVYDFSKMTAAEGMALIREMEGDLCGRLWRRADGTVLTADCPVGVRRAKQRRWIPASKAATLMLASLAANLGCASQQAVKAVQTAPAPETPKVVKSMSTTVDYSQPVPVATVSICESGNGTLTMEVGNLVTFDAYGGQALDLDSPTTGMKMSHQGWERLPLR